MSAFKVGRLKGYKFLLDFARKANGCYGLIRSEGTRFECLTDRSVQ